MAQLMPLPLTVSCFRKIQIGFTFLVPAHPGSPGKRVVKRVCMCVCVCVCVCVHTTLHRITTANLLEPERLEVVYVQSGAAGRDRVTLGGVPAGVASCRHARQR